MLTAPERLGGALTLLEDPRNQVVLSAVSTWEISIKASTGRLPMPGDLDQYLSNQMSDKLIEPMVVDHRHALRVVRLPWHHRDPFDRMLIAQAEVERLPIMTTDRAFEAYDCEVIRVGS
jgi:PIN domain nuclease of toxin-antitoxin system